MSNPEKKIKWDEEVISLHNQERGTRQKVILYFLFLKISISNLICFCLFLFVCFIYQIDEPPTPFSYLIDDNGDEKCDHPNHNLSNNWEEINAKLHYEAEKQKLEELETLKRTNIGEPKIDENYKDNNNIDNNNAHNDNHNEGEEYERKETKQSNFAQKRASHYNEFYVLKSMRNARRDDEDEDDEEDDDNQIEYDDDYVCDIMILMIL